MNNNKNIIPRRIDKSNPRASHRKTHSEYHDSDTSLKSPTSGSLLPDQRNCVFVRDTTGYGFKITGNAPVKVQAVRLKGSAWNAGLRENDIILKVNGESVIDKQHSDVVALIRKQTQVELLVKGGDQISTSFTSQISPKINLSSPQISVKSLPHETENSRIKTTKPTVRPKPGMENALSKDSLYAKDSKLNSLSDHSDSVGRMSDSSSDCSIGTSSTETDFNSNKDPKSDSKIKETAIPQPSSLPKSKPQPPMRPKVAPKPKPSELDLSPNKTATNPALIPKLDNSLETDYPVKSNSYNAPSNKTSSQLYPKTKKSKESPKNRTIPSDGVKSNRLHINDRDADLGVSPVSTYSTLPKKNNGLILGRDFDSDNKEDEDSDNQLTIIDLLSKPKDALSRTGLVSVLLQYVNEQPLDLNVMMLYYACQYFKSVEIKKDYMADAPRLANEIITTFILEKSPLHVAIDAEVVDEILRKLKSSDNVNSIFDPMLRILFQRLTIIVENVKGKLQRGLTQSDIPSLEKEENREQELSMLHKTLCNIFGKTTKDTDLSDFFLAKNIGLATIYQYFYKPSFFQTSSLRSRSTDGINTMGNQGKQVSVAELFKVNIFCTASLPKSNASLRKKPKSISGHSIVDAVCVQPEDCGVCDYILWGPSPQGLFCINCQSYFHTTCKKKIKITCLRKSRKSVMPPAPKEVVQEKPQTLFGRLSRKSSTNSVKANIGLANNENTSYSGNNIFSNNNLIPDEKTNSTFLEDLTGVFKAKSEDQLHKILNPDRFGSFNDVSGLTINHLSDNTGGGTNPIENNSVSIQELVQDESLNDPDMKVDESFDAGAEIQTVFPNIDSGVDQKRLIVLLEFYHKTRYILMNLKRFLYKLVQKWPKNQYFQYFKALSLDCIEPFVDLIKSLVTVIQNCIQDQGFVDLEKAVFDWLSQDNDKRLKEWITLSSNLCCTNSLNIVKQLKQTTMRTIPELINLLNFKMHKMVIVEELTQIRPLLISLPLIVKNIIKCFTKSESQYPEELAVWKDVSIKMDYLCEYIDRCCIPLVDWINNGSIIKRSERDNWPLRYKETENINPNLINYCLDFPRTLFHFPIFDFQMAKIFAWSRNTKRVGIDSRINYLKKGADVLLIFYKSLIVVLQKENDHYSLKPIKPFKSINDRLFPIIETSGFMATKGGQEEDYQILNIISKPHEENVSLVRVGFTKREFVDNWLDYIGSSETHNLSRSISLYKLNDIKQIPLPALQADPILSNAVKLRTSESFSNHHSNIIIPDTPPSQQKTQDQETLSVEQTTTDEVFENQMIPPPAELIEGMNKVRTTIDEQKEDLSKFLNIPQEQYDNALELVTNQGPKSLEDMTLVFYSLCGSMVDHTQQLISASPTGGENDFDIDKDEIKKTLVTVSNLLQHLDSLKKPSELNSDFKDTNPRHSKRMFVLPPSSRIQLVSNLSQLSTASDMTPNEIIEDVKGLVNDVVENSVDQMQEQYDRSKRNSYKYAPENCLISNNQDKKIEISSFVLTPTFYHLNSPVEDVITTTRAQIILNRN